MLQAEKNQNLRYAQGTFAAFWLISAGSTAIFGMNHLTALWDGLVSLLPLSEPAIRFVSQILGAITSVMLADVAYVRWRTIRRKCSNSVAQLKWAALAEQTAFVVAQTYSVTTVATGVFGRLFAELSHGIGRFFARSIAYPPYKGTIDVVHQCR